MAYFLFLLTICSMGHTFPYGGAGFQYEEAIPIDEYNVDTTRAIKGRVVEVAKTPLVNGTGSMVVATMGSGKRRLYLLLAPDWFLDNRNFSLEKGDLVFVKGSQITYNEEPYFVVSEIKLEGRALPLRDERSGRPLWGEWRRGEEIFYDGW